MSALDWIVLTGTLVFIVSYGVWKTRGAKNLEGFLKGDNQAKWWGIGSSIMATQASAITFLSTPGQAYNDGMGFLQFYFGLPLAMIILSVTFIPLYYRLKVFTAYEFLESRFDVDTRWLAAILFLIQRGLAAGITIYAPAIILSTLLGWNLAATNILIGLLVIVYTVSGGTRAVTQTQKQQMAVMMGGMVIAGIMVISLLPENIGFSDALHVAGKMDRLETIDFEFDLTERYNIWSGMIAALFLFLSYFGTDQSQVQRYLGGRSLAESRLGLIMNGLLKVPMQFVILFIGVMVFVFYQFNEPPVFWNQNELAKVEQSEYRDSLHTLQADYTQLYEEKKETLTRMVEIADNDDQALAAAALGNEARELERQSEVVRKKVKKLVSTVNPAAETNDKDYVFMTFVMNNLPIGLVGLLFAVMFSAAMSSTASELNALASTTTIDLYKRKQTKDRSDRHYVQSSRWFTLLWGLFAIGFALSASLFENLIQAVNYLGSMFYGTILGIFVVAFFFKWIKGRAVFLAALVAELAVIVVDAVNRTDGAPSWLEMSFLWYNLLGCVLVVAFGLLFESMMRMDRQGRRS